MGRRSAYSSAPQNVCDAVKRKDIVCLPARSHTFNHEAKMLACKGIFARPSMPSPCRRHGWGQSPRRLQSSIRRRQLYHEAKMCARTNIFARPSMPSPCRRHGWGQSPRRLQSSIRRRQLYHEAKMCACTDIFARPSIAQPRIARKRQSRLILPFSKIPSIIP